MSLAMVVEHRKTSVKLQQDSGSDYILPWNWIEQNRIEEDGKT